MALVMQWLQALDADFFLWVNRELANPVLDQVMPFFSGNTYFIPALLVLGALMVWKCGSRGVVCLLLLLVVTAVGDGFIVGSIKDAVNRSRPFLDIPEARLLLGKGRSGSFPSAHAANWFAAAMVAFLYYRRSLWFTLPLACTVAFSRVYCGVHYPGDVVAGAILGAGYAVAIVLLLNGFWRWAGQKWFPLWWKAFPSLVLIRSKRADTADEFEQEEAEPIRLPPKRGQASSLPGFVAPGATLDQHWLRLGYVWIALVLFARLLYIAGDTIQLSEDEAYQWVWSKHPALSYYSKPPLIAYTQFLGTTLWGDTEFGVRFFSPVIAAILGFLLLRFFAREVNARAGFFLLLISSATPLMAAGSVLMTIDPLSVLFWTAAMLAGWRAVQERSGTGNWLWVGLWMGMGFLSKYTQLFQLLCWAVFFMLWPQARKQLRRPGPYLALLINLALTTPVLVWNAQHDWITVAHLADRADATKPWEPTLRFFGEFLAAELGLLNPFFFIGAAWASVAFWRRHRRNPKMLYFFSMGAPLFLCYLLFSFKSRVLPNWIAPSVVPLFCLMVMYWDAQLRLGKRYIKGWLAGGLTLGFAAVLVCHDTDLVAQLTKQHLPVKFDPLRRVRGWEKTAELVGQAREELLREGNPVFIIANHYGLTGQLSFYLPEARESVEETPVVYCVPTPTPRNQFYFWPGYGSRKGQNAVFVRDLSPDNPAPKPPPDILLDQFESVTEIGITNVMYRKNMVLRPLQLFACRGLK